MNDEKKKCILTIIGFEVNFSSFYFIICKMFYVKMHLCYISINQITTLNSVMEVAPK